MQFLKKNYFCIKLDVVGKPLKFNAKRKFIFFAQLYTDCMKCMSDDFNEPLDDKFSWTHKGKWFIIKQLNFMKTIAFLFLVSILAGCRVSSPQTELFEIDISRSHPSRELRIQTVADVEYVALETTGNFLLDSWSQLSYVSDNYIVVWQRQGDIFVFNSDGKALHHFNRLGGGPDEYPRISNVVFDEKNEEIFVSGNFSRIIVYSISGNYKRTLALPDNLRNITVYNFDDETLLVYDATGLLSDEYREEPYLFVSKQNGSIVSTLGFSLPVRYSNRTNPQFNASGEVVQAPMLITTPNNIRYGEDFLIADISSDTIYMLTKNKDLAPILVRKPSVYSSSPFKTVLTSLLKTDKFIFLWRIAFDIAAILNNQNIYTSLMYEIETGRTYHVSFINDDFPSWTWIPSADNLEIGKNMTADLIDTALLKDAHDERKLRGELEKLVETLDEEDNPVLMIVKFR